MNNIKKYLLLSVALILLVTVLVFTYKKLKNPVWAEVGDYKITKEEAQYRDRVIRIYYPQDNRRLGLQQLIGSYIHAQILKNNGAEITEDILAKEEARIDKQTLVPETLSKIKGIFGPDNRSYRRVFILPTYADRVIYFEFFLRDPKVHGKLLTNAEDFLKAAKETPDKMRSMAENKLYPITHFTVSQKEGLQAEKEKKKGDDKDPMHAAGNQQDGAKAPPELDARFRAQMEEQREEEAKKWINDILKPLKQGEVYGKLVDQSQQWYVVRNLGLVPKKKDTYQFDAVIFPKADYGAWSEAEMKKVKVVRYDDLEQSPTPTPAAAPAPAATATPSPAAK